ncbi:MAG TPA: serine--tRNA ligase [Candidatus Saccharimonadia bacterium]|nr:serine--tRNA ligase [Candidatus Saccharimonadia bacterium]
MIDIRVLREQPEVVKAAAKHKNAAISSADIDRILELDTRRRELTTQTEQQRQERNELSGGLKKGKPTAEQIEAGKKLKAALAKLEGEFVKVDAEYLALLKQVPNLPAADVPVGKTEDENVVAKTVGEPTQFAFEPKNHWQIGEAKGWIDKERAAKVAGSRFAYLKGDLVRLHLALINFALDVLTDEAVLERIAADAGLAGKVSTKPFVPVLPPLMIRTEPYEAMDRLEPRDDRYKIEGEELWLQGSAEHVLGSMHAGEILPEADLPVRYAGYATSFRKEAGTYGKDMEGILRMHQFDKLELESITTAETSLDEHLFMIAIQEYLVSQLELPYQVIMKCTADIGKPNARGVDIDTWLPGQGKYRETHTADYMTDYQTRRLQLRVRRTGGAVELAHSNDATALSMRPLIAIIENYQQEDGSVKVPKALVKYYGREFL